MAQPTPSSTQFNIQQYPVDQGANNAQQPTVVVTQPLRLPDGITTLNITQLAPKLNDTTAFVKYLADMIDSFARLALNACIAGLTWISVQANMAQKYEYASKIADTIKEVTDLAKKYCIPPQQTATTIPS